ncbi:MAG: DUF839 domain-containing protein [Rhodospirillaceae bacterium]|nr:MAG: DUF839 domain-containing protein [Rhodospirillaceae bacterium]
MKLGIAAALAASLMSSTAMAGPVFDALVANGPLAANNNVTRTDTFTTGVGQYNTVARAGGNTGLATPFVTNGAVQQQVIFHVQQPGSTFPANPLIDQLAIDPSRPNFLFTTPEIGASLQGGLYRVDLTAGTSIQISDPNVTGPFSRGDLVRFTDRGTALVAEESGSGGRLFEVLNPFGDPNDPVVANRPITIDRPAIGRLSHEGYSIDKFGNSYVADENFPGGIFRLVPTNPNDPLAGGQLFALRVSGANNVGAADWVALNNPDGTPIAGITDPTVNARQAVADYNAANPNSPISAFNRPEDFELQTLPGGREILYVPTTGDNRIYAIDVTDPAAPSTKIFVDTNTIDAATGLAVGSGFSSPDNIAISAFGDICVTEDIGGSNPVDDIFCAQDADGDGVAEAIVRLGIQTTFAAEPTGILFDPLNPFRLFVNTQHADGGRDFISVFSVPEPGTLGVLGAGAALAGIAAGRRRRR